MLLGFGHWGSGFVLEFPVSGLSGFKGLSLGAEGSNIFDVSSLTTPEVLVEGKHAR